MSGYLQWLASGYPTRTATFRAAHHRLRGELQNGGHKRTVDAGAQLLTTWETFITFATDTGALTADEGVRLWGRVHRGVLEALEPQASLQAQSDPISRFYDLLTGLFTSYRAHLVDAATGGYPGDGWGWETYTHRNEYGDEERHRAKGDRIGWVEGEDLYLEPGATYRALSVFAREQGEGVPVTERTLWKRLDERGVLVSRGASHLTIKRTLPGAGRVRVLHLALPTPVETGATGTTGADSVQDSLSKPDMRPTPENGVGQHKGVGQDDAAPLLGSGAAQRSGARESASETAPTPHAPVAPQNTGVEEGNRNVARGWVVEL